MTITKDMTIDELRKRQREVFGALLAHGKTIRILDNEKTRLTKLFHKIDNEIDKRNKAKKGKGKPKR